MDITQLISLAVGVSVLLLVVGLGMRASVAEATSVFRRVFQPPHSLLRAIIAMNLVVPLVAAFLAGTFALLPPVKVAIVAMSISPVPPILPAKQLQFGGRASFVYGLLVVVSVAAVVFVPASVELLGWIFHGDYHFSFLAIAGIIAKTILTPLAVGMIIRTVAPAVAERWASRVLRLGNIVLVVGLAPVIISSWKGVVALIGDGTVLAMIAMVAAAVCAGHWIGGPNENDRTALGIVCAMRHPGVALAIATRNFPDEKSVPAAIILFAFIAALTTSIYGKLRFRYSSPSYGKD